MREMLHFVVALISIAILIYVLGYCLRMREERFGLFGDHSKEWEGFQNKSGKKIVSTLPSGVASDVKSTLDSSGDFKGSPNEDLLHQLNPKMPIHKVDGLSKKPDEKNKILNETIKKQIESKQNARKGGVKEMPTFQSQKIKPGMGHIPLKKDPFANRISQSNKCGFFSDRCPNGYETVSGFGIRGLPSGMTLQCGNVSSQSGKFIAEIQNGVIKSVNVIHGGSGYDKNKNYKVIVNGGNGSNAQLEAIIDDKGTVQVINVLNGGSGYTSTPQIIVQNEDGTGMGSSCQFCCPSA